MKRHLLVSLLCMLLAGLIPAPMAQAHGQPDIDGIPYWAGDLRYSRLMEPSTAYPAGTRVWYIEYDTTTPAGGRDTSGGVVIVPPGQAPPGGWPVVAWDHGTTGIGDECAPSRFEIAAYRDILAQMVNAGYAVTATDYAGLGTPGIHPYLISESEALATIDAVRAARQLVGTLSTTWVAAGHSQGGQAAIAAAELADDYDGSLNFEGAAAFAPAPNMTPYVDAIASPVPLEQQFYAMMLVGLKTQHPDLVFSDYLGPRARALLDEVVTECFDELTTVFENAALPASEFQPVDQAAVERLRAWFLETEVGHQAADGPLLVLQGTADTVVPEFGTASMVALSRSNGSGVDYQTFDGATHGSVLVAGAPALFAWLDSRLAN